jgi:rhodanese-related sulfurtransferase
MMGHDVRMLPASVAAATAGFRAAQAHCKLIFIREMAMASVVANVPAAPSDKAERHFGSAFEYETDCADVHAAMSSGQQDFVLLDVRGPDLFEKGHVPGALNLPQGKIVEAKLKEYPPETLFVVYCAGPHCNGAHRGALRLARLGRPVKLMIGGVTGWVDEGFELVS